MMDVLVARSIPSAVRTVAWATGKLREATALRRRVKKEASSGGADALTMVTIVTDEGAKTAVLLKSEVKALLGSQPLKDGLAHGVAFAAAVAMGAK